MSVPGTYLLCKRLLPPTEVRMGGVPAPRANCHFRRWEHCACRTNLASLRPQGFSVMRGWRRERHRGVSSSSGPERAKSRVYRCSCHEVRFRSRRLFPSFGSGDDWPLAISEPGKEVTKEVGDHVDGLGPLDVGVLFQDW